jgi:hypothetical protein
VNAQNDLRSWTLPPSAVQATIVTKNTTTDVIRRMRARQLKE